MRARYRSAPVVNQAMTRDEYDNETVCATCGRALAGHPHHRNINGRLVHRRCPKK